MKISKFVFLPFLLGVSIHVYSQNIDFENTLLKPIQVFMSLTEIEGKKAVRVTKDTSFKGADAPTFVRLDNTIDFKNGSIECKVLSRLLPNASISSRGFIGLAFRINEDNSKFECIYIRPTNGRADEQIRRNHSTQYFSYPDYKFDRLRKEAPGEYESYADMGLNEWITIRIVVKDAQAKLFLKDNAQPSLIVNDLKHGPGSKGSIGFFVDVDTEGFFSDLKVVKGN